MRLTQQGIDIFEQLQVCAIANVSERFYAVHEMQYRRWGVSARKACQQDLEFHLKFLRSTLEFGNLEPFIEYLRWLNEVLVARNIPTAHLIQTLEWFGEYFREKMTESDGYVLDAVLRSAADSLRHWNAVENLATAAEQTEKYVTAEHFALETPELTALETALLSGDRRKCNEIVSRFLHNENNLSAMHVGLLQPALINIGLRWQRGQITVAHEHIATATAQSVMAEYFSRAMLPALNGKKAVFACIEGNEHVVGLRMVSDAFELAGWDVRFMGANTPSNALMAHIREWKPDCVGISVCFSHQLESVRHLIQLIRESISKQQPFVLVGGIAVNRFSSLAAQLGADGCAHDAVSALKQAELAMDVSWES